MNKLNTEFSYKEFETFATFLKDCREGRLAVFSNGDQKLYNKQAVFALLNRLEEMGSKNFDDRDKDEPIPAAFARGLNSSNSSWRAAIKALKESL